jgi:hypothetical protein
MSATWSTPRPSAQQVTGSSTRLGISAFHVACAASSSIRARIANPARTDINVNWLNASSQDRSPPTGQPARSKPHAS